MAKRIIRLPGTMSKALLRLIGAAITFIFTFFIYASGQIVTSAGAGRTAMAKLAGGQANQGDSSIIVTPAYGIVWYGPVISYGHFTIKGTIKSLDDQASVANAKILLQDTTTKQVVDSAFTTSDGSFSMTFDESIYLNTWIFEVRDAKGAQGVSYFDKDTLISIPPDSLKGGSGSFKGADTVDVELYLQKVSSSAGKTTPHFSKPRLSLRAWRNADGTIGMQYTLLSREQTRAAFFNANGALVNEVFERYEPAGKHEARLETAGLSAGIYFLKLQAGEHVAITKIPVER
jgi:putative lipoprotein (rSAM/lipoprotein system)